MSRFLWFTVYNKTADTIILYASLIYLSFLEYTMSQKKLTN